MFGKGTIIALAFLLKPLAEAIQVAGLANPLKQRTKISPIIGSLQKRIRQGTSRDGKAAVFKRTILLMRSGFSKRHSFQWHLQSCNTRFNFSIFKESKLILQYCQHDPLNGMKTLMNQACPKVHNPNDQAQCIYHDP